MAWFKLDDEGAFHPKVLRAGNEAYGAWCRAGQWVSKYGTNGFIPDDVALSIGRKSLWDKLESCGGDGSHGLADRANGGWMIHDYLDWNPTGDEVHAKRCKTSEARREAAKKRWEAKRKKDAELQNANDANAMQNGCKTSCKTGMRIKKNGVEKSSSGEPSEHAKHKPVSSDVVSNVSNDLGHANDANAMQNGCKRDAKHDANVIHKTCPVPVPVLTVSKDTGASANAPAATPPLTLVTPELKTRKPRASKEPKTPTPADLFWGVWRKAYQDKYGTRYQPSTADGNAVKRIAELATKTASEVAPEDQDGAERVMRHWCVAFLADRSEFLTTQRHGLRYFERDISRHGDPWSSRAVGRPQTQVASQRPRELVPEPVANPPSLGDILSASIDSDPVSEQQEANR